MGTLNFGNINQGAGFESFFHQNKSLHTLYQLSFLSSYHFSSKQNAICSDIHFSIAGEGWKRKTGL